MARNLPGAQYSSDARNVEFLAAQMALTTWRTILMGVPFEIYSNHDSLKYLFSQKLSSQRILRLCEFLADYDFQEIKYVPGPENVVPDFFSRQWDSTMSTSPIQMLTTSIMMIVAFITIKK